MPDGLTGPQKFALSVLATGDQVEISNETDYDQRTVHWRPALLLHHKGYAEKDPDDAYRLKITADGRTAAARENVG